MKKIFAVIALCVMTFWSSHTLRAGDFGVIGGASYTRMEDVSTDLATGYHAGLTWKFRLPFGFAIQPSFIYNMKASTVESAVQTGSTLNLNVGYAELPVSFQWGPDLLLFRPFLDVTPFVGYAVNNEFETRSAVLDSIRSWENKWDGMNRLEYGLGLGGGIEIWKLQFTARYNWNFGPLFNEEGKVEGWQDVMNNAKTSVFEGKNFGGVTLSLALLF
jgi:hypothetical protein